MYKITETQNGYDIYLTRGDTLPLSLTEMKKNKTAYTPSSESTIRFAMKARYSDAEPCLEKNIPYDTLAFQINPSDTKTLTMGRVYVYDIEITDELGAVDTFIRGNFEVGEEVD